MGFAAKAQIRQWWRRLRYGSGPQSVPKILDAATLAAALETARTLRGQGVDVRALAEGEEPGEPRPVGDAPPSS